MQDAMKSHEDSDSALPHSQVPPAHIRVVTGGPRIQNQVCEEPKLTKKRPLEIYQNNRIRCE